MNEVKITYKGQEYVLCTTLRTAYTIQNQFGHKPYLKVFNELDNMVLEQQVRLLYIAFNLANPDVCTEKEFFEDMLDSGSIIALNTTIAKLIEAISFNGLSEEEIAERKKALQAQTQMSITPTM